MSKGCYVVTFSGYIHEDLKSPLQSVFSMTLLSQNSMSLVSCLLSVTQHLD
jgi:hypothetical protein